MRAVFAYNYNQRPRMDNNEPKIEVGGPTSAFSRYKVSELPEIQHKRKDAFRKIKIMFGLAEPCGASKK